MKKELATDTLNIRLTRIYADTFHILSERYLCEQATKSFSLKSNTNVTKAGTQKRYHLRLTRQIKVARK